VEDRMRRPIGSLALFSGILALAVTSLGAQTKPVGPPRPAKNVVSDGVSRAKKEKKVVLVDFEASWCPACGYLDRFLDDSTGPGQIMRNNYVVVRLDALETTDHLALENPGSADWAKSMGNDLTGTGFPFMIILDGSGKKIGDSNVMPPNSTLPPNANIGYPRSVNEVIGFDSLLLHTAPHMSADERAKIKAYLDRVAGRETP
jgi:thioredoxin-related protein